LKAVPDRYSFSSGFGRGRFSSGGGQPWFVVGTLEFTTTVTLIAANIVWMFVYAAEGRKHSLTRRLWLTTEDLLGPGVLGGEVWRLVTWPLVAEPSLWTVIGLAFFYIFGGQMEALMGRRHFFSFILALTLVPAIIRRPVPDGQILLWDSRSDHDRRLRGVAISFDPRRSR
jgi:membrane associated rhomboid family serine protease